MQKAKNILITGESGFIGSHLTKHFVTTYPNYVIHALDCLTYASNKNFTKNLESFSNYHFHKIDIRNRNDITQLFIEHNISDVIHLAAESHVDNSIKTPLLFAETNILGTINLLDAFKKNASGKFLHVSTDEVYGDLDIGDKPFTESSVYAPNSPYSASKAASDHFVHAYYKTYGINTTITNCSNNYGPHQHCEKLIPTVIFSILKNKKIPIYGTGKNIRDWLYVGDHVGALDLIFHKADKGTTYNIGANNELSNIELIHRICDIFLDKKYHANPRSLISFVPDRLGHDKRYAIDYSKLNRELSWKPVFDFDTTLKSTIDWYVKKTK